MQVWQDELRSVQQRAADERAQLQDSIAQVSAVQCTFRNSLPASATGREGVAEGVAEGGRARTTERSEGARSGVRSLLSGGCGGAGAASRQSEGGCAATAGQSLVQRRGRVAWLRSPGALPACDGWGEPSLPAMGGGVRATRSRPSNARHSVREPYIRPVQARFRSIRGRLLCRWRLMRPHSHRCSAAGGE
jgi:hypothetical protein